MGTTKKIDNNTICWHTVGANITTSMTDAANTAKEFTKTLNNSVHRKKHAPSTPGKPDSSDCVKSLESIIDELEQFIRDQEVLMPGHMQIPIADYENTTTKKHQKQIGIITPIHPGKTISENLGLIKKSEMSKSINNFTQTISYAIESANAKRLMTMAQNMIDLASRIH